ASVGRFRSGFATVETKEGVGYVNAEGQLAIPARFSEGRDFDGELALVERDDVKGYINRQGDFVWQTDQWDEPVRNRVEKPLSDFLPPKTVEALPLEYNWGRVENAIVFASDAEFKQLPSWFTATFGKRFKLLDENGEPGTMHVSFF